MADDGQAAAAAASTAGGEPAGSNSAAGGGGAQGGAEPAAAANQQAQGQQAAPDWKAGIPQHMLRDTAEATLGEVFKAFDGFQKKASAAGPVGKSPDDYKFEFEDKVKPYFGSADDPALKAYQAAAHELGLPVKTANALLNKVFGPMAETGKLPPPFNPKAELDGIAKLLGKTGAEAGAAIEQASTEMEGWAKNVGKQLSLSDGEQIELESMMLSANGFGVLMKLQKAMGGDAMKLGGERASPRSKEEVFAMMNDPRANPSSPNYDEKFVAEYEAEMDRLRAMARR